MVLDHADDDELEYVGVGPEEKTLVPRAIELLGRAGAAGPSCGKTEVLAIRRELGNTNDNEAVDDEGDSDGECDGDGEPDLEPEDVACAPSATETLWNIATESLLPRPPALPTPAPPPLELGGPAVAPRPEEPPRAAPLCCAHYSSQMIDISTNHSCILRVCACVLPHTVLLASGFGINGCEGMSDLIFSSSASGTLLGPEMAAPAEVAF